MRKQTEFGINDLLGIGMTLVVLGVGLAYGLQVMGDVREDMGDEACSGFWNSSVNQCQDSTTNTTVISGNDAGFNATGNAIEGVAKIPEKLPTIATVVVAAVILGVLVTYLYNRFAM